TTLFNALTGSNQYVGNWPGVTVEKKEGKLKNHDDVTITDLPGIYSLSPYTLEEVVARNYLLGENPDAVLNIIDGTNLERNLYLTTQVLELGIPTVVAINMMDIVEKNGDKIDIRKLAKDLSVPVVEISALKGTAVMDAAEAAIKVAKANMIPKAQTFSSDVEAALTKIEALALADIPEAQRRWYAVKLFERDDKVLASMGLSDDIQKSVEDVIAGVEAAEDDDAESIITNERYMKIGEVISDSYVKQNRGELSTSDKIDKVVTNRWLGLPIFVAVMFLVYYISVTTVGTWATDWANDGVFGDGWHLFHIGTSAYNDAMDEYAQNFVFTDEVKAAAQGAVDAGVTGAEDVLGAIEDGSFGDFDEAFGSYGDAMAEAGFDVGDAVDEALEADGVPNPANYGIWVTGIPVMVEQWLDGLNTADWLKGLILDGIIGGVGAVLGFVPQMMVLFIFLAFLESCGYMARVAFILDRIFRKFGLSGKSFIPILIGTGCGVPGVMASRTIENERDRRMTIMTTTFIPCGAKLPIISMIAVALFGGAWWVGPSAYFLGIAAIIVSGIMLKKTQPFAGEPAPFVMELPAYHMPTVGAILRSMWERCSSFIKKAGTVILIASIVVWVGSVFGRGGFNPDMELEDSILGMFSNAVKWIFAPLGFDDIRATIATIMGLVAKEEVVGVFGVLDFAHLTPLAGYSFLAFNLLCAPCFAAIGAIKREMNNAKWTWFAIGYQCLFAYAVALIIYQVGLAVTGAANPVGLVVALALLGLMCFQLFRPYKEATTLTEEVRVSKAK
ncbi:MAG: ferrous iron transporter B, partial [Acutalibacteraceae bacterium]|nr:ferrous iron transporter B [Acutalibacteraceae bacterium]